MYTPSFAIKSDYDLIWPIRCMYVCVFLSYCRNTIHKLNHIIYNRIKTEQNRLSFEDVGWTARVCVIMIILLKCLYYIEMNVWENERVHASRWDSPAAAVFPLLDLIYIVSILIVNRSVSVGTTIEDTDHWTQRGWWIACDLPCARCMHERTPLIVSGSSSNSSWDMGERKNEEEKKNGECRFNEHRCMCHWS